MSDNNNAGNGENKQGDGGSAGEQKKTDTQVQPFDVSKIGDEDFNKIFDDPRLYKHTRFKSLNERANKLTEFEQKMADEEKKKLEEQGKFKELAEKSQQEAEAIKNKYNEAVINNSIILEATKIGVADSDAVLKLIDRKDIKLGDDGSVTGVADAIKGLLEAKPFLKGSGNNTTIGSGTNPSGQSATGKRFKLSQIQDPAFYRANEADIMQAQKLGLIEIDR